MKTVALLITAAFALTAVGCAQEEAKEKRASRTDHMSDGYHTPGVDSEYASEEDFQENGHNDHGYLGGPYEYAEGRDPSIYGNQGGPYEYPNQGPGGEGGESEGGGGAGGESDGENGSGGEGEGEGGGGDGE